MLTYFVYILGSEDFVLALGRRHVTEIFPSPADLVYAVDQKWEELDNIIRTNQFPVRSGSEQRQESRHRHIHDFISCHDYEATDSILNHLTDQKGIIIETVYSSALDNRVCVAVSIDLGSPGLTDSMDSPLYEHAPLLVPIPNVLKLERGLHQTLDWEAFHHIGGGIDLENTESGTEDIVEMELRTEYSGPMMHKLVLGGENVDLSVIFRRGVSSSDLKRSVTRWNSLLRERPDELRRMLNSFYWSKEEGTWRSSSDLRSLRRGPMYHSDSGRRSYDESNSHWLLSHRRSLQAASSADSYGTFEFDGVRSHHITASELQTTYFARTPADYSPVTTGRVAPISTDRRRSVWRRRKLSILDNDLDEVSEYCGWKGGLSVEYRKSNVVVLLPRSVLQDVRYGSNSSGVTVRSTCLSMLSAVLASDDLVTHVAINRKMRTQNNYVRGIVQSGAVGSEPFITAGLNGSRIIVGVSDTGIDRQHCFFRDDDHGVIPDGTVEDPSFDLKYRKVIQYINFAESSGDYKSGHGTHVSGTIAGYSTNTGSDTMMGMAPAAKLAFFDIGLPNSASLSVPYDFTTALYPQAYVTGARLHSNSWGGNYWYDSFCLETDDYMYQNQEMLALFAAGNEGQYGTRTTLSPGISKNVLSVAACDTTHSTGQSIDYLAAFSSTGPAPDGRIKPDLTAPGNSITSANSNGEYGSTATCGTVSKQGTSMATPAMGGTAALVQQYFRDDSFWNKFCNVSYPFCRSKQQVFIPSGPLIKAVLIQSGVQMSLYNGRDALRKTLGHTPDSYQGFGRVNLKNVLPLKKPASASFALFVDQRDLSSFQELVYTAVVTSTSTDLRVTLAWFDPPNPVFASKVLLHDLDLVVEQGNKRFYGNGGRQQNGYPDSSTNVRDELNNVEQVIVSGGVLSAGTWTIRIQSKLLTEAPLQSFALVVTLAGYVSHGVNAEPQSISPSSVMHCASNSSPMQTQISMFDWIGKNGWGASTSLVISKSAGSAVSYSGTFVERQPYKQVTTCLSTGSFSAQMNYGSGAESGSLGSIPQCGVFLAPLHISEQFTIAQDPLTVGQLTYSYTCETSCAASGSKIIDIVPYEESGEGWYGAYYSLQVLSCIVGMVCCHINFTVVVIQKINSDKSLTSVGAGTLEWDFYATRSLCFAGTAAITGPASTRTEEHAEDSTNTDQCYWLHLSVPSSSTYDYYPELFFVNTLLVDEETNMITQTDCPYQLRYNETLAMICHYVASDSWDIVHYAPPLATNGNPNTPWLGFGQTVPTAAVVAQVFNVASLTKLGTCRLGSDPTPAPTMMPTRPSLCPTPKPTTSSPTVQPTRSPTPLPTPAPTSSPSQLRATDVPTAAPTRAASDLASTAPTLQPSPASSTYPTPSATPVPTSYPTSRPTAVPTSHPTSHPTSRPTSHPTSSPTSAPSPAPTSTPTAVPTVPLSAPPTPQRSAHPTQIPNPFDHMDYSCFQSCAFFPVEDSSVDELDSGRTVSVFESNYSFFACDFLIQLYDECNSVDIALGNCPVPSCAQNCPVDVWCYFGAGATVNCPNWLPVTCDEQSMDINARCVDVLTFTQEVATLSPTESGGAEDITSHKSISKANMRLTLEIGELYH
jgi:hypothetical protein